MNITQQNPSSMPFRKYRKHQGMDLPDRTWPSKQIERAPIWCSVDLRDGNQALIEPMTVSEKLTMFKLLVAMGFKEIEVGFPAASTIDFDFVRLLIEENHIPDDVVIQVLCQAREHLIQQTFASLKGCKRFIFHLYNSTSEQQRRIVFKTDKEGIKTMTRQATEWVKDIASSMPESDIYLQYSPESFTLTELDFALEICETVSDIWQPTYDKKIILNLPATVEVTTPNVYADQIEWFIRHLRQREATIISLHTHNDRGTTIAASELGLLAGADRIEGTLFGNGERTGNADIINLAMNLYSQGIDPELEMADMPHIVKIVTECNKLPIHIRQPYAGRLVFTAFSGSHQDAIHKGMQIRKATQADHWDIPYLPIDPADVGARYEETVRVNSQSGKGGVAFILESWYGVELPRAMQAEFHRVVQHLCEGDKLGAELSPTEIWDTFLNDYSNIPGPFALGNFSIKHDADDNESLLVHLTVNDQAIEIANTGSGTLGAFTAALNKQLGCTINICDYKETSLGHTSAAQALCIVGIESAAFAEPVFAVGVSDSTTKGALAALIGALNRAVVKYGERVVL